MTQTGGSLFASAAFRKILSIGYEFESHDLAKLSLTKDKKALINSDLTLRTVDEKMQQDEIRKFAKNYLTVHVPKISRSFDREPKTPDKISGSRLNMNTENDALTQEYIDEFGEEESNENEIDEELQAFFEYYEEEAREEKFREKEKNSYLEYFYEKRDKDTEHDKEHINFQLTNDNAETYFATLIDKKCKALKGKGMAKNKYYLFKTRRGKIYRIHFTDDSLEHCASFSGIEVVVTYYKPKIERQYVVKSENPNIILDTFVDAISRIVDHFANLKKIRGSFLVADDRIHYSPLGSYDNMRELYYKPGTNLFYMATYDEPGLKTTKNLATMTFAPQMTFRCNAYDVLDIIKEIISLDKSFKLGKKIIKEHRQEAGYYKTVEDVIDKLIDKHNDEYKNHLIHQTDNHFKTFRNYMFFIFYKIYCYIQGHGEILKEKLEEGEDKTYLKDYLSFASRHSNAVLYERVKEIANEIYGITDTKEIQDLFFDEMICDAFFSMENAYDDDYDEDGNSKYGDASKTHLKKGEPNYGDPMYSLSSYFRHFEDHDEDEEDDWFIESKIDIYSTTFDLTDDKILLENRYFTNEFILYAKNTISSKFKANYLTLNDMVNMVNKYYEPSKMQKMINLEYSPIKRKLVKKCKPGFIRSNMFKCMIPRAKPKKSRKSNTKNKTRGKTRKSKSKSKSH